MERIDNSKFLLYLEPPQAEKLATPIMDDITAIMTLALREATVGTANYSKLNTVETFTAGNGFKGMHLSACGERSTNHDYLLKNGMITNSLCTLYVKYYRNSIPPSEMEKLKQLVAFYQGH